MVRLNPRPDLTEENVTPHWTLLGEHVFPRVTVIQKRAKTDSLRHDGWKTCCWGVTLATRQQSWKRRGNIIRVNVEEKETKRVTPIHEGVTPTQLGFGMSQLRSPVLVTRQILLSRMASRESRPSSLRRSHVQWKPAFRL